MQVITEHAIDRYVERWRPTASREQARHELCALLSASTCPPGSVEFQPYGLQQVREARLGARVVRLVFVISVARNDLPDALVAHVLRTVLPDA